MELLLSLFLHPSVHRHTHIGTSKLPVLLKISRGREILVRLDSLGWLVEFITKFLQFQPKVQQQFFSCRRFDYSVVVFFKPWQLWNFC